MRFAVGDRVTVDARAEDPSEVIHHPHVIIVAVRDVDGAPEYMVGHPPAQRWFGPYPAGRLAQGWVAV